MQNERFIVKYVPVKNCFVQIPSTFLRRLPTQVVALKLSTGEKDVYLSSSQSQSSSKEFFCVNATLGKCLNIREGSEVLVSHITDPPALTSITVVPFNNEDWQIVNLQAEKIQSTLLDQISIVAPNQPIVVWLSKYLNVTLLVKSISPSFMYGKLENYTEVYVQDATQHKKSGDTAPKEITPRERETDCDVFLKNYKRQSLPHVFRVCFVSADGRYRASEEISDHDVQSPHTIFVRLSQLKKLLPDREHFLMTFATIESVFKEKQSNLNFTLSSRSASDTPPDVIVSLSVAEEFFNEGFIGDSEDNVWVSDGLKTQLQLQLGSKVYIKPLSIVDNPVTSIEIFADSDTNELQTVFQNHVKNYSSRSDIVLTTNSTILLENKKCRVKIHPEDFSYVLLNEEKMKKVKIQISNDATPDTSQTIEETSEENFSPERIYLKPIEKNVEVCVKILQMSLNHQDFLTDRENIVICGNAGTGKSTFLHVLKHRIQNAPNFMYTAVVDCKKLKGKKVDVLAKFFTSIMHDCAYYQPSVLLLDNLESITSYPSDEENSPDAINATRISESLSTLMTSFQSAHLISVVATCTQMDKLGSELRSSRGVHVFQTVQRIPNISKEERIEFMKFKLKDKMEMSNKINWESYGEKTEGWVFQDLVDLSEKSIFVAWKKQRNAPILLTDEDLFEAFGTVKPLSLYGVSLFTGEGSSWEDIGGLEDVKESLKQLLQWPLTYSGLFAKAPVKHQSGILLYGMPGTGKTMLAGAIAKECGLNFINIKGPELLSKYIGASEEAVRGVFEKAQRIKPCIIFFDEFDSLAPRRGHDSTGVTDRVVNQLLTQFDGVEGREGVAIVAASSRPDLLDPALLRPGRLDKSLLCPLPDEQTREKILNALCKRYNIDTEDLDLTTLSSMTGGFTGADLNAVLTQARLNAVEELWSKSSNDNSFVGVKITQEMLIQSLESTQPSLTTQEISKFNRIYNRFFKGDNFTEELLKNPKATLA